MPAKFSKGAARPSVPDATTALPLVAPKPVFPAVALSGAFLSSLGGKPHADHGPSRPATGKAAAREGRGKGDAMSQKSAGRPPVLPRTGHK